MKNLESVIPIGSVNKENTFSRNYAEKELLARYMSVSPESKYDSCQTCNNCGSGNCASCCSSTDD